MNFYELDTIGKNTFVETVMGRMDGNLASARLVVRHLPLSVVLLVLVQ